MSDRNLEHMSSKDSDKRYFPRWEVNDRVLYQLDGGSGKFYEGKTRDLSCAGACIIGENYIEPHSKVELSIQLSEEVTVQLKGRILWVKTENNQPQIGITFYNTTNKTQDLILQHAFEMNKDQVVKQWNKGWSNR